MEPLRKFAHAQNVLRSVVMRSVPLYGSFSSRAYMPRVARCSEIEKQGEYMHTRTYPRPRSTSTSLGTDTNIQRHYRKGKQVLKPGIGRRRIRRCPIKKQKVQDVTTMAKSPLYGRMSGQRLLRKGRRSKETNHNQSLWIIERFLRRQRP